MPSNFLSPSAASAWKDSVGRGVDFLTAMAAWCTLSFALAPVLGRAIAGKNPEAARTQALVDPSAEAQQGLPPGRG